VLLGVMLRMWRSCQAYMFGAGMKRRMRIFVQICQFDGILSMQGLYIIILYWLLIYQSNSAKPSVEQDLLLYKIKKCNDYTRRVLSNSLIQPVTSPIK